MTGRTKARIFKLRRYMRKTNGRLLKLSLFIFTVLVLYLTYSSEFTEKTEYQSYEIKSIQTEENLFTVTFVLNNDKDISEIQTFIDLANSLSVKPALLATVDWYKSNSKYVLELIEKGHAIGVYVEDNLNGYSKNRLMNYFTDINDEIYNITGKYSKYIRVKKCENDNLKTILNAQGQYLISAENNINGSPVEIKSGNIIEIDNFELNNLQNFTKSIADAMLADMSPSNIKTFLYGIENEVNAEGIQIKT